MKYNFVGTCVNSFDENGNCTVIDLPWSDVTDFAQQEENATIIYEDQLKNDIYIPDFVLDEIKNHDLIFLKTEDDTIMIYDDETDIHYFFRK